MPRPEPDDTLQFRLTITCDNAAFEDSPEAEIARILRVTAAGLEVADFDTCRDLRDVNGNVVGQAALKTVFEHDNSRRCCAPPPADLVSVAQFPDGSFSVDLYDQDGSLATTFHLPADAPMADAFPAPKGDPQ